MNNHQLGGTGLSDAAGSVKPLTPEKRELPFTPRVKSILAHARKTALAMGADYIGAEHVAAAVLDQSEGPAHDVVAHYKKEVERACASNGQSVSATAGFAQEMQRQQVLKFIEAGCTREDLVKLGFL